MNSSALLVLAGTIVGVLGGIVGQLLVVRSSARNERRRLAIESGFREWERYGHTLQPSRSAAARRRCFHPSCSSTSTVK
jgi:hypothetical protein